jgi:diguanylate cyclase (GGDEF)-like protein
MAELNPPAILILVENPDLARRLAAALGGTAARLWLDGDTVPLDQSIDVIVTDLGERRAASDRAERFLPALDQLAAASPAAVLGIGPIDWADVALPGSTSDESIQLACKLLAEIARLRAKHDMADRAGQRHRELAYTDPLTGLANRRAWNETFAAMESVPAAGQQGWCLAILDLDRFKQVNEAGGLTGGDQLLVEVAGALSASLRQNDLVARIGGDEFGVVLSNIAPREVAIVLERLRAAVAGLAPAKSVHPVTVRIGYAAVPPSEGDPTRLFATAEQALREAKRAGGNRVVAAGGNRDLTLSASGR